MARGDSKGTVFYTAPHDALVIIRPRPDDTGYRLILHLPPDDGTQERAALRAFAADLLDTFAALRDAQEVEGEEP